MRREFISLAVLGAAVCPLASAVHLERAYRIFDWQIENAVRQNRVSFIAPTIAGDLRPDTLNGWAAFDVRQAATSGTISGSAPPISAVPPVVIERLIADGIEIFSESAAIAPWASEQSPQIALPNPVPQNGQRRLGLSVPSGANRLEIHYRGINPSIPDGIRFRYKLQGYEDDWTETDSQRKVSYTRVPPGQYVFQAQASLGDGIWHPQSAELAFRVRPLFWQTWWFRGTGGLVVAAMIAALSYGPIHRRRGMERLRLRIARDLHDEVGAHLGTISLYNQLAQAKRRDDPSSLTDFQEIDRAVQRTAQSLRDAIWFINPEFDTLAGMLQHMEDAANRSLAGKKVIFQTDSPVEPKRLAVEFRRNMFLIYREVIHNILKHSQAKRVVIVVSEENRNLVLEVSDDGVGFNPVSGRKGHGLKNMAQRTDELRGVFEIESRPGEGSMIRVTVPMP